MLCSIRSLKISPLCRPCCYVPGRCARRFPSGQQKSCSLKRAVAHSPGQQRCHRPVVGPEAHTRVAPLDVFNSNAVPIQKKRHNLSFLQVLMGEDEQRYFLQLVAIRCSDPAQPAEFLCSAILADDCEMWRPRAFALPGCEITGDVGGIERGVE